MNELKLIRQALRFAYWAAWDLFHAWQAAKRADTAGTTFQVNGMGAADRLIDNTAARLRSAANHLEGAHYFDKAVKGEGAKRV